MGIIHTDQWLQKEFEHPIKICERLIPYFNKLNANTIYHQLLRFGMFKPGGASKNTFEKMKKENTWSKMEKIYHKYRKKWSGPQIPIFLFPIAQGNGFFRRAEKTKSGVSFGDKMFLFLSDYTDEREMEALFVHEYHHVCRIKKLSGNVEDYTLLDSMIIEGLAEYAVLKNCGKKYNASWCSLYSEREIFSIWNRLLKHYSSTKKKEKIHDDILYGNGRFPQLGGYAAGFSIVRDYYQKHPYSAESTFSLPAKKFIEGTKYDSP